MSAVAAAGVAGHRVRVRTALASLLLGLWIVLQAPAAASAHATLVSSTPGDGQALASAPSSVELIFDEPVQLVAVRLVSRGGAPQQLTGTSTDRTVRTALPALSDGNHALSYRIVSQDGHPISGAISFQVGQSSGPSVTAADLPTPGSTEATVGVLTGLQYLGLLVLAGLVFFERVVVGAGARSAGEPRGSQSNAAAWHRLIAASRSVPSRVLRIAAITAIVSATLLVPALALRVAGAELAQLAHPDQWLGQVGVGPVAAAVLVLLGCLGVLWCDHRRTNLRPESGTQTPDEGQEHLEPPTGSHIGDAPGAGRGRWQLVAAAFALAAPVLVGHTMSRSPQWAMVAADMGHLFAGAFWVGGLAGLLIVLVGAGLVSRRRDPALAEPAAALVAQFSKFALWAVALLAASGLVMALLVLRSLTALLHTNYGWLLLAKLAIVLVTVLVAAWNRVALLPRIRRRPASGRWASLLLTLVVEASLLLNVVVVTGLLTNANPDLPAASTTAAAPRTIDETSQNLTVRGRITPGQRGDNEFSFTLAFEQQPVRPKPVIVKTSLPAQQLGPFVTVPTPDASGTYHVRLPLTSPGEWKVEVSARIDDFTQPIAMLTVPID